MDSLANYDQFYFELFHQLKNDFIMRNCFDYLNFLVNFKCFKFLLPSFKKSFLNRSPIMILKEALINSKHLIIKNYLMKDHKYLHVP